MDVDKYQCCGSMDPQTVRQAFNRLLPTWQSTDLAESNRLEDARVNLGPCGSAPPYIHRLRSAWPVVKAIAQPSLILPADSQLKDLAPFAENVTPILQMKPISTELRLCKKTR